MAANSQLAANACGGVPRWLLGNKLATLRKSRCPCADLANFHCPECGLRRCEQITAGGDVPRIRGAD